MLTVHIDSGRGPGNRLRVSGAFSTDSGRLLRNGVVVGTVLQSGSGWRDPELSTAIVDLQSTREKLPQENEELNLAIQKLLARLAGHRSERHEDLGPCHSAG